MKFKVTYEFECNSSSGEINFSNLVDVIDITPYEHIENPENNESQVLI